MFSWTWFLLGHQWSLSTLKEKTFLLDHFVIFIYTLLSNFCKVTSYLLIFVHDIKHILAQHLSIFWLLWIGSMGWIWADKMAAWVGMYVLRVACEWFERELILHPVQICNIFINNKICASWNRQIYYVHLGILNPGMLNGSWTIQIQNSDLNQVIGLSLNLPQCQHYSFFHHMES